jgi:hypothetical protein
MTTAIAARQDSRLGAGSRAPLGIGRLAVVPVVGLGLAVVALTGWCRQELGAAAAGAGGARSELLLYVCASTFLLAIGAAGLLLAARLARRVAGPEYRLIEAMRRMRSGDISFRVHLRRGDPLTRLADECNELLEWLNRNPPRGTSTGTDLVDVEHLEADVVEVAT